MSDASSALAGLGSDLAFTISFAIARELLDGANESGISQDELIAVVLALGIVFPALPRTVTSVWRELPAWRWPWAPKRVAPAPREMPRATAVTKDDAGVHDKASARSSGDGVKTGGDGGGGDDDEDDDPGGGTGPHTPDPSGLGAFLTLLVDMGKRISVSVCVQLLASSARATQVSRPIRVVMLLGVVMYFLFLDALGSVGARKRST